MNHREILHKGWDIENQIVFLLRKEAKQTKENAFYDIDYKGLQIEVKSAELRTKDGKGNGSRWGRFLVSKNSHKKLKEQNGWYALAITFKGTIILLRFIQANSIHLVVSNYTGLNACIPLEALYNGISLEKFRGERFCK